MNEYISVNSNYHITILTGPYCGYLLGSLVDLAQSIFTKAQGFLDFRLKVWDIEGVKEKTHNYNNDNNKCTIQYIHYVHHYVQR